jgi:hypothetical protein
VPTGGRTHDATDPANAAHGSPIYFSRPDIVLGVRELEQRGITFTSKPHLIASMEDYDLLDGVL